MRYFLETFSEFVFIHEGVIGKISQSLGRTTHLASWAFEDPLDLLYHDSSLYTLAGNKVFKVEIGNTGFGTVVWSAMLSGTPLRVFVTGEGYLQVLMTQSSDIVSVLYDRVTGSLIRDSIYAENVGNSTVLDAHSSAIVLAERSSATLLTVRYYGTSSWETTLETFGDIQAENLTLRFVDNGNYLVLGYNEWTEGGGWDPRIILLSSATGSALWTTKEIFSTPDADRLSGVFSDPLSSDIYLIYSSESGLMSLARIQKSNGSVGWNLPIPPLTNIFGSGTVPPTILSSMFDNNHLNILFSTPVFVGGLDNSHSGTYHGVARFSVSEPTPANSIPTNISITEISSFVFDPNVLSYELFLPNTSSSVTFQITQAEGQASTVKINGRAIDATSFYVPIGPTDFQIVITAGSSSTTYSIRVVRDTIVSGPTYVNMTTGTPSGRGTSQYPIKNLNQAMKLVNKPVILRVKDFLPLAPDTSFQVTPVKPTSNLAETLGQNTVRLKNPNSLLTYALSTFSPVRSSINGKDAILSFFIKVFDESEDQFIQNFSSSPLEFEFNLPSYYSRSQLRLYREEANGTTTEISGGITKVMNSLFSLALETNSVYTVTDSDSIIPSAGIGSDPHITTLFGETYTLHKLSKYGSRLNILKTPHGQITGRVTGLSKGEFLDSADISVGGKSVLSVKFGGSGSKVKILDSSRVREIQNVHVEVDKFRKSSRVNRVFFVKDILDGGVYLFVNDQHRYICPIPLSQPDISQKHLFSGLLSGNGF